MILWQDLVASLPQNFARLAGKLWPHPEWLAGIALDSRQVQPGYAFVALVGEHADGHAYIPDAIQRGAALVIGEKSLEMVPIPYLRVANSREALAHFSAALYGLPARQLTVIGVTGTDGKTTTANLIYQILLSAGYRAGMISTVNAVIGNTVLDTGFHVTTPEAPDIQNYLAQMVHAGLSHVVLETTSHGLDQHRVTACEYDLAVVTNITHEHLDYHRTYEAYLNVKSRLFTSLALTSPKPGGNYRIAVLNRDDASYEPLVGLVDRHYSYGIGQHADVRAGSVRIKPDGLDFLVSGPGFEQTVSTWLVGEYNVSNCLAALTAACLGLGIGVEPASQGIAALKSIPGRMERIDLGQDFLAIVDFAHTPNALRVALQAARQMVVAGGRVIAVFGSAGLRDRQKRRLMAQVSIQGADLTILTAEDPRTESLDDILGEMAAGAQSSGGVEARNFWRVPDRGEALRFALSKASPGDVVIALGKGHEQSMCFGEVEYPWDDRVALRAALAEYLGVPGPPMPFLPTQG